ncbi:MAG TPA: hypothetical protein VFR32_02780 [Gaiellaceae bacterium]|nr:hypothetical protein [Gaiellaceae bacterium]
MASELDLVDAEPEARVAREVDLEGEATAEAERQPADGSPARKERARDDLDAVREAN